MALSPTLRAQMLFAAFAASAASGSRSDFEPDLEHEPATIDVPPGHEEVVAQEKLAKAEAKRLKRQAKRMKNNGK